LVGLISGLFNCLAAMPGPPVLIYYMSVPFDSVAAHASLLTFFLITSTLAMLSIALVGLIDKSALMLSIVALPAMLIGNQIGTLAFRRGSEVLHRRIAVASLGVVAFGSACKGFSELI
jgi:uncharacterized protein